MYYSMLDPQLNAIYKATSTDGLAWKTVSVIIEKSSSNEALVDPDVFAMDENKYIMYFGKAMGEDSTAGGQINLYQAELNQSIF